jgi:hypothetical protein
VHRTILLAALLLTPGLSCACTCGGQDPICSAYWQTPVVFRGRVLEQTLVGHTVQAVKNLDGTYSTIESPGYKRVRFSVLESFKGDSRTSDIVVLTNEQESACGVPFEDGVEYLVFTYTNQSATELWTSRCSHTHALEPGNEDADVSWLRSLAKSPRGATIFGRLLPPTPDGSTPTGEINVRGPENREAVANENGTYTFSGLHPGAYSVAATLPPGFATPGQQSVTVLDRGCAQVDWPVRYDGHVRGTVTDASGNPLRDMFLVLQRRDSNSATGFDDVDMKDTDADGRYDFASIPPGDYLVSVNHLGPSPRRPYPHLYYPAAETATEAANVHLSASGVVEGINVRLPNAWKTVTVQVRVMLPDGTPVGGADVDAYDLNYLASGEPAMAVTDAAGRASVDVYEGRSYYLVATISGGTQQRCAGPLKFTGKDGSTLRPITIEHNWGNCLAQLDPQFQPPH